MVKIQLGWLGGEGKGKDESGVLYTLMALDCHKWEPCHNSKHLFAQINVIIKLVFPIILIPKYPKNVNM